MTNRGKYILLIGMGDWTVPQLEIAAGKGYDTIVTNRNEKALALQKADIPILADGRDVYSILSFLYQNHLENKIHYIYTGTELFTSAALIAQTLNIRWHSPQAAYICENKNLMREKFQAHNIPLPVGFSSNFIDLVFEKIIPDSERKYILKPSDSLSAQGVTVIENRDDIRTAFNEALRCSTTKTVVCEEYIEGSLHDVNGILTDDGLIWLGINDKKAGPLPYAVVVEGSAPTLLSKQLQHKVYSIFEKACRTVGLTFGPVKGDLIKDHQDNLYVMEVAPRLHGPLGSLYVIPLALGITPFSELLNWWKQDRIKAHDPDKVSVKKIFTFASDSKQFSPNQGKVLQVLEKDGISDRKLWKSNNDVPFYVVWEKGS